ncbi:MAG TPA: histidine kinase [Quisquiliibacterium sp.]|nr:histidine kinase [Quisquiliibacterium sp.]
MESAAFPSTVALPTIGRAPGVSPWAQRLALLLESTGEGIFGIDTRGCCVFINRAGAEMLGHPAPDVIGRDMHALTHHTRPDGQPYPHEACPIFAAFREGTPCRIDRELFWRADGTSFPVEYSSHPIVEGGAVLGAVVTFVDITARRAADEALRRANEVLEQRVEERTAALSTALEQLRRLSTHLESVREHERTRIAREIHDELGSLLVALKMDLGWLAKRLGDRPELLAKGRAMSRLIDTAVGNVGRIITDLRPSILDHQGLWAALEWHAQEFARTTELDCRLRFDVDETLPEPPQATAIAVFRIFQEMLSNVARHARARRVTVDVVARDGVWIVRVDDDGVGASAAAIDDARSWGVLGMRERARQVGGTLRVQTAPGQGTCVELRVEAPAGATP